MSEFMINMNHIRVMIYWRKLGYISSFCCKHLLIIGTKHFQRECHIFSCVHSEMSSNCQFFQICITDRKQNVNYAYSWKMDSRFGCFSLFFGSGGISSFFFLSVKNIFQSNEKTKVCLCKYELPVQRKYARKTL